MAYQSTLRLLGLPLVHVAPGRLENGAHVRGVARGWIAVGDVAFGVLFAAGGFAVGGVGIGGVALGVLSLGGLSVGLLALGGLAIGGVAAGGGGALAWWTAFGGGAIAVWGAMGGLAVAQKFAIGGLAIAPHANDAAARQFFAEKAIPGAGEAFLRYGRWALVLLAATIVWVSIRASRRAERPSASRRS
jgi:hypothetical protein